MHVAQFYSHLNGYEHIKVHKAHIWNELMDVISAVDAGACRTKVSKEKTMRGKMLYSPVELNRCFKNELERRSWKPSITRYWVTADHRLIRKTVALPAEEQKRIIEEAGETPIMSYNQTDFIKERIELEVQFGKYAFVAFDMFVKHMAFYVGDKIDVGVEILPMKSLEEQMSSGVPYYERGLYDLLRQGRSTPAVPLVVVGIIP